MDASPLDAALTQLMSLGVLWITFHCAGMCGPLVVGLDVGGNLKGIPRPGVLNALGNLVLYQSGRAGVYALLGAGAGLAGGQASRLLSSVGPYWAGLLGILLIAGGLGRRASGTLQKIGAPAQTPAFLAMAIKRVGGVLGLGLARRKPWQTLLLGVLMSALPCMLVAWALTLAASTQSAWGGALVMVVFTALTTVPLGLACLAPAFLAPGRLSKMAGFTRWLIPASGAWLLMVSAAAAGLVPHASLNWTWAERGYTWMFW